MTDEDIIRQILNDLSDMGKKKRQCTSRLIMCSSIGDANAGTEAYCNRPIGHSGKHSCDVTCEFRTAEVDENDMSDLEYDYKDVRIFWK